MNSYCSLNCFPKGSSLPCARLLPLLMLWDLSRSLSTIFSKTITYCVLEISVCTLDKWRFTIKLSQGRFLIFPWNVGWRTVIASVLRKGLRSRAPGADRVQLAWLCRAGQAGRWPGSLRAGWPLSPPAEAACSAGSKRKTSSLLWGSLVNLLGLITCLCAEFYFYCNSKGQP